MAAILSSYDPGVLLIAYLVVVFGAFTGLQMIDRMRRETGRRSWNWLYTSTIALGGVALWSGHFIALLAERMAVRPAYDLSPALAALGVAVGGVGVSAALLRGAVGTGRRVAAGMLIGATLAGVHYLAMTAVRLPGELLHDARFAVLAGGLAAVGGVIGLALSIGERTAVTRIVSALVMGAIFLGAHHVARMGSRMQPATGMDVYGGAALSAQGMVFSLAIVVVILVTFTLLSFLADGLAASDDDY